MSRYQKCETNIDFTEAKDSEWQWHQLGHMQICTLLQTDNHTSTPPLLFFTCPFCRPTDSVKALKANMHKYTVIPGIILFSSVFLEKVTKPYPFGKVTEKDASKASDLSIVINNARCHLADLTLDFDHVVQNQMSKYKQCVLADRSRFITQSTT